MHGRRGGGGQFPPSHIVAGQFEDSENDSDSNDGDDDSSSIATFTGSIISGKGNRRAGRARGGASASGASTSAGSLSRASVPASKLPPDPPVSSIKKADTTNVVMPSRRASIAGTNNANTASDRRKPSESRRSSAPTLGYSSPPPRALQGAFGKNRCKTTGALPSHDDEQQQWENEDEDDEDDDSQQRQQQQQQHAVGEGGPVIGQLSPTERTLPVYEEVEKVAVRDEVVRKLEGLKKAALEAKEKEKEERSEHGEAEGDAKEDFSSSSEGGGHDMATSPMKSPTKKGTAALDVSTATNNSVETSDMATSPRKFYEDSYTSPVKELNSSRTVSTSPQQFYTAPPPGRAPDAAAASAAAPTHSTRSTLHTKLLSCRVFARLGKKYHLFVSLYRWRINALPPTYIFSAAAASNPGQRKLEEVSESCIFALRSRLDNEAGVGEEYLNKSVTFGSATGAATLLNPPLKKREEPRAVVEPLEPVHVTDFMPQESVKSTVEIKAEKDDDIDFLKLGLHMPKGGSGGGGDESSGGLLQQRQRQQQQQHKDESLLPYEYRETMRSLFARYGAAAPMRAEDSGEEIMFASEPNFSVKVHVPSDFAGSASKNTTPATTATVAAATLAPTPPPPSNDDGLSLWNRRSDASPQLLMSQRIADLTLESLFKKNEFDGDGVDNGTTNREILEGREKLKLESLKRGVEREAVAKANDSVKKSIKWLTSPPPKVVDPVKAAAEAADESGTPTRRAITFRSPLRNIHNDPWRERPENQVKVTSAAKSPAFEKEGSEILNNLRQQINRVGDSLKEKKYVHDRSREELDMMRARLLENAEKRAAPRRSVGVVEEEGEEEKRRRAQRGVEAVGFATELVRKITSPVLQGRTGGRAPYDLSFLSGLSSRGGNKKKSFGGDLDDDVSAISNGSTN
jgi:hypothetical protein